MKEEASLHLGVMSEVSQLAAAGKFKEAVDALKQNPTYDAEYFYNLGVLYGKMNQPGLAAAYLEKANREKPHDPEIMRSLRYAQDSLRQYLVKSGVESQLDSASTQLELFSDRIQGDEILGAIGLITVIVSLLWIRAYLKTRNITKTFLKPSGWYGALGLVLMFAFYGIYRTGSSNPPAVLTSRVLMRSGPGLNFPEIQPIEAGIKIRIIGSPVSANENELWQKVRYKSGQTAWVPLANLLPL